MLRGVSFEEETAENFFCNLLELMDVTLYDWFVDDVLDYNYKYFRPGKYSGEEFGMALEELSTLSFARIRRYPIDQQIHNIDVFEDYERSACDFLLLFYDGGYYEVYEKDKDMISLTMDYCIRFGFDKVAYIDDADFARSYMHY